jgi:hypothetical protein
VCYFVPSAGGNNHQAQVVPIECVSVDWHLADEAWDVERYSFVAHKVLDMSDFEKVRPLLWYTTECSTCD